MKRFHLNVVLACVLFNVATSCAQRYGRRQRNSNQLNVYGQPLQVCSTSPMTGWYRDGKCTKLTLEIATIRNSYERQLAEADEEGEKARKGLLRQIEQLKMQHEDMEKAKNDILKVKKNLEIEVGNLNEESWKLADKTIAALNA